MSAPVLAIDTSDAGTSVGLMLADGSGGELFAVESPGQGPGHSRLALAMVCRLLEQNDVELSEVGLIAATLGPGSFTGVRIGIATAEGLALGLGARRRGVSSLAALIESARSQSAAVVALIDARRGELFAAVEGRPEEFVIRVDGEEGWWSALPSGATCVGSGAVKRASELAAAGFSVPPAGDRRHRISGLQVARLARDGTDEVSLKPVYLRDPDALPVKAPGAPPR